MTGTRPADILRRLEQTDTDAALLARFVTTKDGPAFAELVRRHGPLVLGVCRRVTGQTHDAEDAFQATFLVLAQKAGSLRNVALLGNWLYGVAFRVASRAKRSARRRRAREVTVSALPEPPAPTVSAGASDIQPILDEELAALAACYRDAIVLCDLRGTPRADAAVALGVPEGTLSSRLATGRKKLAARLARRGVALSVTALPMAIAEVQAAIVSNELVAKTCGLVADWAAGGAVPGPLARLTEGGFAVRKMLVLGVAMAFGVAGAVLAARPVDAPPDGPPKSPVGAEKAAVLLQTNEEPKANDQPTVTYRHLPRMVRSFDCYLTGSLTAMWNPKGTHFAIKGEEVPQRQPGQPVPVPRDSTTCFQVFSLDGKEVGPLISMSINNGEELVAVLPNGVGVLTSVREYHLISGSHQLKPRTRRPPGAAEPESPVDLELPETHGYAFSADLKTFRTVAWEHSTSGMVAKLEVFEVDATTGRAKKALMKLDYGLYALSANGKRIAVLDKDATKVTVYDLDRAAKVSEATLALPGEKLAELPFWGEQAYQPQEEPTLVLSPNGKRLIVSRAIGQTYILNADTGEAMPPLEGVKDARVKPHQHAFTQDGRLLAMPGMTYRAGKVNLGRAAGPSEPSSVWHTVAPFLTVWDTQTGKALKTWNRSSEVTFNPVRPLLAILEPNGEGKTRIGFWDFAAEAEKK